MTSFCNIQPPHPLESESFLSNARSLAISLAGCPAFPYFFKKSEGGLGGSCSRLFNYTVSFYLACLSFQEYTGGRTEQSRFAAVVRKRHMLCDTSAKPRKHRFKEKPPVIPTKLSWLLYPTGY